MKSVVPALIGVVLVLLLCSTRGVLAFNRPFESAFGDSEFFPGGELRELKLKVGFATQNLSLIWSIFTSTESWTKKIDVIVTSRL